MKSLILIFILILSTGLGFSDDEVDMGPEGNSMMMSDSDSYMTGGKIEFTTLEDAMEIAATGPVVLFFYASWCPTCNAAINDINAKIDKLGDVTVVIVNYDKENTLKSRYKVFYQHTFIQINSSGDKIAIWSGGGIDNILKRVVR